MIIKLNIINRILILFVLIQLSKQSTSATSDISNCLNYVPYVEENCVNTTYKNWPYDALLCTYGSPNGPLKVTVADPSPNVVTKWIGNASREVNWIAKLEDQDHDNFVQVKKILATDIMLQSGRIFPLKGYVGEDMGSGYVAYSFTDGVADNCPTGEPHAFCRINSITRGQLCAWRDHKNLESNSACKTRLGYGQGDNQEWYQTCLNNHIYSWYSDYNEHFVAKLWAVLNDAGINGQSTGDQIISALYSELGFSSKEVTTFCG